MDVDADVTWYKGRKNRSSRLTKGVHLQFWEGVRDAPPCPCGRNLMGLFPSNLVVPPWMLVVYDDDDDVLAGRMEAGRTRTSVVSDAGVLSVGTTS